MAPPATSVLQTSHISPPPDAAALSIPLTFMDIIWLNFFPIRRLLFYTCPADSTLIPNLKRSLSLTLRHYLPVAGNLLRPSPHAGDDDRKKPFIRYTPGDSVILTVAESTHDFDNLVGNHSRDADQFYDFVPQMPPAEEEGDYKKAPLMALQVTLFPDKGLCIGFANHHSLGDASSIVRFIRTWAEIARLGGGQSIPVFDRSLIKRSPEIDSMFWKVLRKIPPTEYSFSLPTNKVRATYTFLPSDLKLLKDLVITHNPGLLHLSSFVVTTAYTWICLLKSGDVAGEDVPKNENELEYFIFTVDVRGRLDPPAPDGYFGNCLSYGMAKDEHGRLVGEEGFVTAAAAIAEDIQKWVNKKGEAMRQPEKWMSEMKDFVGIRVLGVSGSPRFDLLAADFGWGRARKMEVVSIDGEKYSMSLCKSSSEEGGLEVGLSLTAKRMEAFAAIFYDGLRALQIDGHARMNSS